MPGTFVPPTWTVGRTRLITQCCFWRPTRLHRFVDIDLAALDPDLQPDKVVMAEDLAAAGIRAKGYFTEDLMCPKGQTPAYLGQPVALLLFRGFDKFATARQYLRGARAVVFGEQTEAVARPPYGTNRFTRVGGSDPSSPDIYSPVQDGWVLPPRLSRGQAQTWLEANPDATRRAGEYGGAMRADLDGGRAGRLFTQHFQTQSTDPFFMEPESGLAWHDAANDRLSLVLGVQAPLDTLIALGEILSDARASYSVKDLEGHFAYLGGAFGGKDMPLLPNYVAIAGLFADGRPVRLALDRFEQFQLGMKRHAVTIDSQLGVDPETATFTAFACDLSLDGGGTANVSASVADVAAISSASMYYVPKSDVTTIARHSRGVTAGSMRGYGGLQSITAMECLVDDVAAQMHMDPIELRRKNAMRTGYRNLTGAVPVVTIRSDALLDRLEQAPLWSGRADDRRAFEAAHPYKAYGVGIACSMFKYGTGHDGALAAVSFDADGRIDVAASTVEMGTGTSTAVAVRVADYLGRSADQVTLDSTGPLWAPLGLVTSGDPTTMSQQDQDAAAKNPRWVPVITSRAGASVGAAVTTHAVAEAAYALLRYSLWPAAQTIWQAGNAVAFDDLTWVDGKLTAPGMEPLSFARLAARCHATGETTGIMVHAFSRWQWARAKFAIATEIWDGAIDALALRRGGDWQVQDRRTVDFPPASTERASETYASLCGAIVALSVDRTNGAIRVLRVHEVLDCGRSIVPELVSGMAHGGIAMGLGHALTEYLPLYEDGPGTGTWNINRYDVVRAGDDSGLGHDARNPAVCRKRQPARDGRDRHGSGRSGGPERDPRRHRQTIHDAAGNRRRRSEGAINMETVQISATVNGRQTGPHTIPAGMAMVDFLHEYLGLTGTKFGCGIGVCHACVVIVDEPDGTSRTMRTCINGAATFDGKRVRTVEGHAKDGRLTDIQQAFVDHFAFQCGYCTSGFVNAATCLLEDLARNPVSQDGLKERIEASLGDHICRCTGYVRYYEAVRDLILADPQLTTR